MALSYEEIKLVQGTIPALRDKGEHISTVFYRNMLREQPYLNDIFNTVNMRSGTQPRALTKLILTFASNISHISELVSKMERVAQKHASLGVQTKEYDVVGKYLMRAFAAVLGPGMTPEVSKAWNKAYGLMANMLAGRESQIYRNFGKWTGWRKFTVEKKKEETDDGDIVSFVLTPVDKVELPEFMPGQYISLHVHVAGTGHMQTRQYSLSDAPRKDNYRITVKRDLGAAGDNRSPSASGSETDDEGTPRRSLEERANSFGSWSTAVTSATGGSRGFGVEYFKPGVVSNLLIDQIHEGDTLEITHPAGDFYLDTRNGSSMPLVLMSGGIGASPLMSMLNSVVEAQPDRPVSWIQGARHGIPFESHVRGLQKVCPALRAFFFKTRLADRDTAELTFTHDLRVDLEKLNPGDLYLHNRSAEYFICGPEKFMVNMSEYLKKKGVEESRMHFELYSLGVFELRQDLQDVIHS